MSNAGTQKHKYLRVSDDAVLHEFETVGDFSAPGTDVNLAERIAARTDDFMEIRGWECQRMKISRQFAGRAETVVKVLCQNVYQPLPQSPTQY